MSITIDNALIMAAGTSSRFAPLSSERPKGLTVVHGEIMIMRQIRQLKEAGIPRIIVVTGYMAEAFAFLKDDPAITLLHNPEWATRNNHASIRTAQAYLGNSYICSADNYFTINPFTHEEPQPYYAAVFAEGKTKEWCLTVDPDDRITAVTIGGQDQWVMMGHVLWDQAFTKQFLKILDQIYDAPKTKDLLWEAIYAKHIDTLTLHLKRYRTEDIFEFDTLEELRAFDDSYRTDTRSVILKRIAQELGVCESDLSAIEAIRVPQKSVPIGITLTCHGQTYHYDFESKRLHHG